jgi:hypothetical protein
METNKKFKNELVENELTVTKADKDKTRVILKKKTTHKK